MMLAYGDMPLDRCTNQRKDKRWLSKEFTKEKTIFCVIDEGMCFFVKASGDTPLYLTKANLPELTANACVYLGQGNLEQKYQINETFVDDNSTISNDELVSVFAVDFNKLRFSTQEQLLTMGQFKVLRQITANLTPENASILALAKGLIHWHITNQFCGLCGSNNTSVEAGHARRCNNCRNMTFPRTDPAVIMLVEKMFDDGIPRCLLGRQANWDKGVYSTLAGFVDPGETLEQAVIREVHEESGLVVENPQYCTSQPWPFPASIMLGFTAVACSEKVDVSQDSLEDAQWFSRDQLSQFGINKIVTADTKSAEFKMSSADSISRYLITAWLNQDIGQY